MNRHLCANIPGMHCNAAATPVADWKEIRVVMLVRLCCAFALTMYLIGSDNINIVRTTSFESSRTTKTPSAAFVLHLLCWENMLPEYVIHVKRITPQLHSLLIHKSCVKYYRLKPETNNWYLGGCFLISNLKCSQLQCHDTFTVSNYSLAK